MEAKTGSTIGNADPFGGLSRRDADRRKQTKQRQEGNGPEASTGADESPIIPRIG